MYYCYHSKPDFSLHTFEIRMQCHYSPDYYMAFKHLWDFCGKNNKPMYRPSKRDANNADGNNYSSIEPCGSPDDSIPGFEVEETGKESIKDVFVCEAFTDRGMTIKLVRLKLNGVPVYYGIWMIINPRRLLGDDTYVGIFDIRKVDEMLNAISSAFAYLEIDHLSLNYFRLHRIDMCRNVFLPHQDMVEMYIEVLKKCFVPKGYSWNEVSGIEFGIRQKDGIKIANDTLAIVAYNKKAQMDKQNGYFSPVHIAEAEGLLRFEIQLYSDRIRYLCRKDNTLYNLHNFFHSCEALSIQHFEQYIPKVFLRGNYFTHEDAKNIVLQSDYYESTKKKMLTLLDSVSIHRNLMTALDDVCRKYRAAKPYDFIRNLLKNFEDLYLNPVTIPRRWDMAGETFLPGAYNQVMGIETLMFSVEN